MTRVDRAWRGLFVAMLLSGALACERQQTLDQAARKPATTQPAAVAPRLTPVDYAGWRERLAGYQPKIVVADLWATWCAPCLERFPKMVALAETYGDRGVEFVSVSFDDSQDPASVAAAEDFLAEVGARFDNFLLTDSMRTSFERFDVIGLPVVLMFDGDGVERVRLTGDDPAAQFTDADVESQLQELLAVATARQP